MPITSHLSASGLPDPELPRLPHNVNCRTRISQRRAPCLPFHSTANLIVLLEIAQPWNTSYRALAWCWHSPRLHGFIRCIGRQHAAVGRKDQHKDDMGTEARSEVRITLSLALLWTVEEGSPNISLPHPFVLSPPSALYLRLSHTLPYPPGFPFSLCLTGTDTRVYLRPRMHL